MNEGGKRLRARALRVVLLLVLVQVAGVAQAAWACGCGGMVPGSGTIRVGQETSVVRWDGRTEQIVMRLTVSGDAPDAAWIMPVPSRADVRLGDRALFTALENAIVPRLETRRYFWPREGDWPFGPRATNESASAAAPPGAPGRGVEVVGRDRLGPFDVARLAATEPSALGDWLTANGFRLPERLAEELRPYVERRWEYVAIRLAPDAGASPAAGRVALGGMLDPLHLTFATDRPVYPMRLSRLAQVPQSLRLYVLADHRVATASPIGGLEPELLFAGRLPAERQDPAVRDLAGGPVFLTALDQRFPRPELIDGDHELVTAPKDTPYRRVVYTDELLTVAGIPAWLLSVLGAAALAVAALVRARRRSLRRSRALPAG